MGGDSLLMMRPCNAAITDEDWALFGVVSLGPEKFASKLDRETNGVPP
jgi:hypothetical protein